MLRAVIIDDEKNAVTAMEIAIKEYCPGVEIVGTALSAKDGIKEIQNKNPDLVFVDIEMPQMTGLEMVEQFEHRKFQVIFVTAYNQFAIKAFKVNATDYLLKPINIIELINAINRISDRIAKPAISAIQEEKIKTALSGKLTIPTATGSEYINIKDIIRIEADGSYSKVFSNDGKMRFVTKNLKSLENSLEGESFFRCHNSHLINVEYIKKYNPAKDKGIIEMTDESSIPVARSVKMDLAELIKKYAK
ncbi:MAG: LytTR family DNA-binding domain-containing protein [Bacteroidota bacterium]